MKKRRITALVLSALMAASAVASASAAELTELNPKGDTQVTARILNPGAVSYIITIPDKVDFGTLEQPATDTEEAVSAQDFEVVATKVTNLGANQKINVKVKDSSATQNDSLFKITQQADVADPFVLEYDLYSKNSVAGETDYKMVNQNTMTDENGFELVSFTGEGQSISGQARLDRQQIYGEDLAQLAGEYTGTMSFYSEVSE